MGQVIIVKNLDDSVSVVYPAEGVPLERVLSKDVPQDPSRFSVVDSAVVPTDRYFRNAWKFNHSAVLVDLEKAKTIHQERLIKVLLEKLKILEDEIVRADLSN